ncbi:MAG TPA: cytochrome c oxidase subunit II [Pyrinomonadaceae bacterium]|nr:cytochrome c oxidase subunit II [Pyrinomonadaceae bacterium]
MRVLSQQVWVPFAPEQASTFAPEVDALYLFLVTLTMFFSVLISVLIVYFAVKYRRRSPTEVPRPRAGAIQLELLWTIIPLLISMGIFAWGASVYYKLYRAPEEAMEIYVVGKQWMWKFQHREGQREINELHVPVGARVKLIMTTEDVIHSFYVPAFRIKTDVVPGRYSYAWFEATKTGRYYLFCAEYCGTNHSGMGGHVVVMEPSEYQQWLAGGATDSPAEQGQAVFRERGCASCHAVEEDQPQGRGPILRNLFGSRVELDDGSSVVANEAYIRESILNPRAKTVAGFTQIMPTYQGQLSEEQILQLIAYLRTLNPNAEATGGAASGASGGSQTTTGGAPDTLRSNPLAPTDPRRDAGQGSAPANNSSPGTRGGAGGAAANSNR